MRQLVVPLLICSCATLVHAQYGFPEPGPTALGEPENLRYTIDRLMRYHDSGEYDRDIRLVVDSACRYLTGRVKERRPWDRLAAVFDIDETALSNWAAMSDCGFCSYSAQTRLYPIPLHDPPIAPVKGLFWMAQKLNLAVFFVTGRPENQREATIKNLKDAGYRYWQEPLFMRPPGNTEPANILKPRYRHEIELRGYTIVLNIGDQASDLDGCCAERVFKLPNPFYMIR